MSAITKLPMLPDVGFKVQDDLDTAVKDQVVLARVQALQKTYYTIDVSQAMRELTQVGQLIQVAYAGSKGFTCAGSIVKILATYQSVIKDSNLAATSFVGACLSALSTHRVALKLAAKDVAKAFTVVARCAEVAKEMAGIAGRLAGRAQDLCDLSTKSLEDASKDESVSREQRAEIERQLVAVQARQASLKSKTKELGEQILEAKEAEAKAAKEADKAASRAFMLSIVQGGMQVAGAVLKTTNTAGLMATALSAGGEEPKSGGQPSSGGGGIDSAISSFSTRVSEAQKEISETKEKLEQKKATSPDSKEEIAKLERELNAKLDLKKVAEDALKGAMNQLNQQQKGAQDKEAQAAAKKYELQKEQREANAEIAESLVKMQGFKTEKDELAKAVASLEVTVKMLGKIKTVFENTRIYWEGVAKHCTSLTNMSDMKDFSEFDLKDDFIEALTQSAFSWLALGRINLIASNAMKSVDKGVDDIMNNLPSKDEAIALVGSLSAQLLQQIEIDNAALAQG